MNGIAHRDYTSNASVQVELFPDKLLVMSPGKPHPSVDIAKLDKPHSSNPVNPLIADALYQSGHIERLGTGLEDLFKTCRKAGLPKPKIEMFGGEFHITIFRNVSNGVIAPSQSSRQDSPNRSLKSPEPSDPFPKPAGWPADWPWSESRSESWSESWSKSWSELWSKSWSKSFPPTVENKIVVLLAVSPKGTDQLVILLNLGSRGNSLRSAIASLLSAGLIERTVPDKPTSRLQKYRLTPAGRAALAARVIR